MNASFQEKSVWVTLTCTVAMFVVYFFWAGQMLLSGVTEVAAYVPLFAVMVVLLVVLLIAGHVAIALLGRTDDSDERDRLIAWRAEHGSSWLLAVGAIAAIFALGAPVERAWVANGLLLFLFLSEALKQALQIYYYRRGL